MVAALLVAGEIKLKVSGREVTVTGQQAIDALKTNNTFKPVGVALRDDRPSMEVLARAAERLTDLSGEQVVPLEEDIGKAAQKLLPHSATSARPAGGAAAVPPAARRRDVCDRRTSKSPTCCCPTHPTRRNASARTSPLYDGLKWAHRRQDRLRPGPRRDRQGACAILNAASQICQAPACPGPARQPCEKTWTQWPIILAQDDFFKHKADLNTRLTAIEGRVAEAVARPCAGARPNGSSPPRPSSRCFRNGRSSRRRSRPARWPRFKALSIEVTADMAGLKRLIARQFDIEATIAEIKSKVVQEGKARRQPPRYPIPRKQRAGSGERKSDRKSRSDLPARIGTRRPSSTRSIRMLSDSARASLSDTDIDLVVKGNRD